MKLAALPRYVLVAAIVWMARGVGVIAQLVSTRVLVSQLGVQHYASFSVVASMASWSVLLDCGLGASVQNSLSRARAAGRDGGPVLAAAIPLLSAMLAGALATWAVAGPTLQAFGLRHLAPVGPAPPPWLLAAIGGLATVTAIAGVGYRVMYARGAGYVYHVYTMLALLVSLGGLPLLGRVTAGSPRLSAALLVTTLPSAGLALVAFARTFCGARPCALDRAEVGRLWREAYPFGGLAVMSAAALQVDYVVMSQTLGARDVVEYTLVAKVFSVVLLGYSSLLAAIWPHCTEALAAGDGETADRLLRQALLGSLGVVGIGTALFLAGADLVIGFLAPASGLHLSPSLIALFGCAFLLRAWSDTHVMMLMSLGRLRVLWASIPAQAMIGAAGQYVLSRYFGPQGIILGIALSFLAVSWVAPTAYRRLRRALARPGATGEKG
jgi:O-antigen/teichoic acid export membrane protein